MSTRSTSSQGRAGRSENLGRRHVAGRAKGARMNIETMAARCGDSWEDIGQALMRAGLDHGDVLAIGRASAKVNGRLTRCLGRVKTSYLQTMPDRPILLLEMSAELLARGTEAEIASTFRHEVAHCAADMVPRAAREMAHGPQWRRYARALGVATVAAVAISYERTRKARRVVAVCDRCAFGLERSRALMAGRVYRHRGCGGRFS